MNNYPKINNKKNSKIHNNILKLTITSIFLVISVSLMIFAINIPTFPLWLKFDFSDLMILLTLFIVGIEYAIILCISKNWIKFLIDPGFGGWIGHLFDMILGLIVIITIFLIYMCFHLSKIKLNHFYITIFSLFLTLIVASFFAALLNYTIFLKLWGLNINNFKDVFLIYFPFTIIKYSIIFTIFLMFRVIIKKLININVIPTIEKSKINIIFKI